MASLIEKYQQALNTPSDIFQHIPTLFKYAGECEHVTEFGVRGIVSTWALLMAQPKKLVSYDIAPPYNWGADINEVYELKGKTEYKFILGNTLQIEIEPTDLLFIDTLHDGEQLKKELELHAGKVSKFIILHDTTTFWNTGESTMTGLKYALEPFLNQGQWRVLDRFENNNGLTVLCRS